MVTIKIGVDIDGCIDSDPPLFLSVLQALRAAGHTVVIMTGSGTDTVTAEDGQQKQQYLKALGLGEAYDQLVVFPAPTSAAKAEWCKQNGVDLLIDNDRGNAQAASEYCMVFLPWASRTGKKDNTDGPTDLAAVQVVKSSEERRYTLGLAYPAMKADVSVAQDGHRDFTSPEVLEQAAWSWMTKHRSLGLQHMGGTDGAGTVVESYIYRGPDWVVKSDDGKNVTIHAGDWLLGAVWTPAAWSMIKSGQLTGFSPQGSARRAVPTGERLLALRS